jgi:hypothetical protein
MKPVIDAIAVNQVRHTTAANQPALRPKKAA